MSNVMFLFHRGGSRKLCSIENREEFVLEVSPSVEVALTLEFL